MAKLDYFDALEAINEERFVKRADVRADALRRVVWVAEWHLPGCLSETRSYSSLKKDAIYCALSFADFPRGMKTALEKTGRFDTDSEMYGRCINTVEKVTLADLI